MKRNDLPPWFDALFFGTWLLSGVAQVIRHDQLGWIAVSFSGLVLLSLILLRLYGDTRGVRTACFLFELIAFAAVTAYGVVFAVRGVKFAWIYAVAGAIGLVDFAVRRRRFAAGTERTT